jgi:hypothetical protein
LLSCTCYGLRQAFGELEGFRKIFFQTFAALLSPGYGSLERNLRVFEKYFFKTLYRASGTGNGRGSGNFRVLEKKF